MGKKQTCPEFENHERWLVSYADMLTLLFAVFVVLFALKEGGEPQVQQTAGSMQESFNTPLADIPLDRQLGPAQQGVGIFSHFKGSATKPSEVLQHASQEEKIKLIDEEMDLAKKDLELRLYGPNKFRDQTSKGFARIIHVERTSKGFKLRLLAKYFYKEGGVQIRSRARKDMDQITLALKKMGRSITIEGHTDSSPVKGSYTNWELSALRATHLVRYMIKNHRFPQTRISATGYADTRPIAHNGTEQGRKLNRRIEIHVHFDDESSIDPQ